MKTVTNGYKNNVKMFGRELDSKITYELDGETIELGATQLNSVAPHYEGGILKSVMKQLDIDSNEDIPIGTTLNYQFGVKVGNNYEYIDYGNFIVYSSEKQEDVNSYKLVCYDSMLYAMKDYDNTGITYPITIRNYISEICTKLGLTFKQASDTFPNYDKEIAEELYIGTDGNSLGYTFRDVLDELAEVTASTICINENDDELELRYIEQGTTTVETLIKDMENGTDVSGMTYTVDTAGYTSAELIGDLTSNTFEIPVGFLKTDQTEVYASGVASGSMVANIAMSFDVDVRNPDGTTFNDLDNTHFYIIYLIMDLATQMYDAIYILNDLSTITKYGDLEIPSGYTLEYYPDMLADSVLWNCMKLTETTSGAVTINEQYLKDVNVNFKEKFGPVNSIVLSRAGGADNVYLQDEDSIEENGLCEIKIEDNQIMNGNDRADYLPDILEQLDGLEYYANDFSSTGITFLELCDMYNVQIGDNTYNCIVFNDETNITQGLEELIYTDIPEETETEYKHASKDDRKINQTYIIAKKNEGEIEALTSSIQDLTDYIKTVEGNSEIELEPIAESDGAIWRLEATGFSELALYPGMSYPSTTNYPGKMTSYIIVTQNEDGTKTNETYIDLGFPLIAGDKLVIENNKVYVERGNSIIDTGQNAILKTFDPKTLISIKHFDNAHIKCQYIEKNEFTKYFATQAQMQSQIQITDEGISSKVSKAELISEINQSAEKISMTSNRIEIDSEYFKLSEDGKITSTGGTIGGYKISDTELYAETYAKADYTQTDLNKLYAYIMGTGSLTDEEKELYDIYDDGELDIADVVAMNIFIKYGITSTSPAKIIMRTGNWYSSNAYIIQDGYGNQKVNLGLQHSTFDQPLYVKVNDKDVKINDLIEYKEAYSPNTAPIGYWVDGSPIYRIVLKADSLANDGTLTIPHNINTNLYHLKKVIKITYSWYDTNDQRWFEGMRYDSGSIYVKLGGVSDTNVYLNCKGTNWSTRTNDVTIVLEFTVEETI